MAIITTTLTIISCLFADDKPSDEQVHPQPRAVEHQTEQSQTEDSSYKQFEVQDKEEQDYNRAEPMDRRIRSEPTLR